MFIDMPRYTVDSLLHDAGRSRNKKSSTKPGYDIDHVVELQLIVAALNELPTAYNKEALGILVDFFSENRNLREMLAVDNQKKGQAVKRFIERSTSQQGDQGHIQLVREFWHGQLERNLQNFDDFKNKLNEILKRPM